MREKKYASDISREKFAEIEPLLCSVRRRTKPTTADRYEVFCAVLYVLRTGCQWRFLPSEFPKWQTVYAYFVKWKKPDQQGVSVLERALKKSGWRNADIARTIIVLAHSLGLDVIAEGVDTRRRFRGKRDALVPT